MMNMLTDDFLEYDRPSDLIALDSKMIDEAIALSNRGDDATMRWAIYLRELGRLGFCEWLAERSPILAARTVHKSISGNSETQYLDALCYLNVGPFSVCLIPVLGLSDPEVSLARAVVAQPDYVAHFYGVIGISEEEEWATIKGFLRYEELKDCLTGMVVDQDDAYTVAIAQFNPNLDELLLNLQCLSPEVISLPQVLSEEQPQQRIDVRRWFKRQLEEMVEDLGWLLLPPPAAVRFVAGVSHALDDILTEIKYKTGLYIPLEAARGYQDISVRGRDDRADLRSMVIEAQQGPSSEPLSQTIRLHAVTWSLPETKEWSLLLVLGATPDGRPPYGVRLQIRDEMQLLGEQVLDPKNGAYIYAHVEGDMGETFEVSILPAGAETPLIYPFTYSE